MNDASDHVGLQPGSNGKLLGGITGKGFMPGRSGNPTGKRKGCVSLTATLKRNLRHGDARAIIRKLVNMARTGDLRATELIFERLDAGEVERRLADLEAAVERQNQRQS